MFNFSFIFNLKYFLIGYVGISLCVYLEKNKFNIFNNIMNTILLAKIYVDQKIKDFLKEPDFKLKKVLLYCDLRENYDVTSYFNNNKINEINNNLIYSIYHKYFIDFQNDENLRLKIYFTYKKIDYIIYYSHSNHCSIPYPPYSDIILNDLRNDIVLPYYPKKLSKKKYFYSLFLMDSKNILCVSLNGIENDDLLQYFDMIQTPFHDFGILYKNPVKLLWVLHENNIDLKNFDDLTINFLNVYFDEEKMDLVEHFIKLNRNDLKKHIISEHMELILLKELNN